MQLSSLFSLANMVTPPFAFVTGLCLQALLTLTLPQRVSFLPALGFCFVYALRNRHSATHIQQHGNIGRFHAQIPDSDGRKEGLVVFITGVTTRVCGSPFPMYGFC